MRRLGRGLATLTLALIPHIASSALPEATTYQITIDHAGVTASGGVLALQETPLWSAPLSGASSYPIIAGGRVFVTTAGLPGSGPGYGTQLYAFDAQTGATLWGPLGISGTYFWSGLTYDSGTLFVVNYNGTLNAYDAATGTAKWSAPVQLPGQYSFSSPPTASNGIVYVGGAGTGGTLYWVNEADGTVLWTASVENGDNSSPAVGPSGVYVSYACGQVYDFDLTTAALVWHSAGPCEGGGGRTPVYANGKVYDRNLDQILDAGTGDVVGSFNAGPAPAVGSTTGYFLYNGTLTATDLATNTVQWSFADTTGNGGLVTAPIVVDQTAIVGSSAGTLYGVNTQTGHLTWQVATGGYISGPDEQNVSQPLTGLAIADGILVVPAGNSLVAYKIFGPPAPTGATATGRAGAVDLNWSAAAGATTYNVYLGTAAGTESVVPVKTGVAGTTTTVTNLTPGTTYFFTVKAVGPGGISAPSNEASATPHNPAPPGTLSAAAITAGVTLSWAASSEAVSYNVYMGSSAGAESSTPIAIVTTTGTTVTGLTPNVAYYFVVKAVSYGALSSPSNEASAIAATAPPPAGVTANPRIGGVTLNWSAAAGATSYNVYSGISGGAEGATPAVSGIAGTTATINGLTASTTYYFVIRSVVSAVPGAASSEVSATVLPTPAPAGLTATVGPGQAVLSWSSSLTATSYNVYFCTGAAAATGLSSTGTTVTGLTPDAPYCFVVKAQGPAGLSAASNQVNVTPLRYAGPTNLVAVPAVGQVSLSWNASPAATQYNIYMGTAAGLEGITPVSTVTGTSATIGGLTNTSIYYFFVTANTPIGFSLPSSETSAAPLTPPPPTNLSASSGPAPSQVSLSWSASAGATSYNLYMGTAARAEASTPVQTGITGLSTIVPGLDSATTYYYVVRAQTPSGLSSASNEASATPAPPPPPPPPVPAAPANLSAVAGANQVNLSWTASTGAASYNIYMGTSAGNEAATPVMATVSGVTAAVTGLTNGTTYFYVVKAVNAGGSSPASNEVSATPEPPPPSAPANLSAVAGATQVNLSWTASTGATSYDIFMGTASGGEATTPVMTGVSGVTATISGLTNGTAYFYVVKATNPGGSSAASNEVSVTPMAPSQPSGNSGGGGAFDLLGLLFLTATLLTRARR
jgi:outer membrane protein assembly factor BamB